jgi:BirA family transcriptional regulator, biotin operon repressor / biotin---[acetyl-CoA-carboxylase] ligase
MHIIGNHRIYLESIDSTNTFAQELLSKSNPTEGTVISAGFQTAGKGQANNIWQSEAGKNILMSFILYPNFLRPSKQFYLSMFSANATISYISELLPQHQVRIKWPNDIYVGYQKLGGMLILNTLKGDKIEHTVVGIGLNINQKVFDDNLPNPVSLSLLTGQDHPVEKTMDGLLSSLDKYYHMLINGQHARLKTEFEEKMLYRGENAVVSTHEGSMGGIVLGISEDGKILMNIGGVVRKLAH